MPTHNQILYMYSDPLAARRRSFGSALNVGTVQATTAKMHQRRDWRHD